MGKKEMRAVLRKANEAMIADAKKSDAAAGQAQTTALAIFSQVDDSKLVRMNLPTMVKPGDVPIGSAVSGEILKIVNSPVSTVKGKLLWLRHENGTEYLFPATGVVRAALAPGLKNDDDKELFAALEKFVGRLFVAKRTPDRQSSKYKKTMFMFDVFTSSK